MKFTPAHMNSVLVDMWHQFQQQSASAIIDALNKNNLLPLASPNHDTTVQACLAAIQTPSGTKSEEIEYIYRASMAPEEVEAISTTDPMVKVKIIEEPSDSSC